MTESAIDTYSYQGWLNSDSFWKRAFGIVGYYMAGILAIYLVIMILIVIFAVIASFVFGMASIF